MRSRKNVSSGWPAARAISTPRTSDPVLYIHRSPGWCISGSVAEAPHPLVGRLLAGPAAEPDDAAAAVTPAGSDTVRRRHDHAEAHAKGEQVAHRDRPPRRHGVVERAVEPLQDSAVGQLRQQPIDRLVQPQPALLDQDHGRRRP